MDDKKKIRIMRNALNTILLEAKEPIIKVYAQSALDETVYDNFVFNLEKLRNAKVQAGADYYIGVDTYDKMCQAFCLVRCVDDATEVLLSKVVRNEEEFKTEVDNLAKYFNATILHERY